MLFFIKVEKNRMIPITSMDPINAPIMTEIKPDKVNNSGGDCSCTCQHDQEQLPDLPLN